MSQMYSSVVGKNDYVHAESQKKQVSRSRVPICMTHLDILQLSSCCYSSAHYGNHNNQCLLRELACVCQTM